MSFVLFYAEEVEGRVQGGTATAVHLARQMQIPTFNLWDESTRRQWEQVVVIHDQRVGNFFRWAFAWLDRSRNDPDFPSLMAATSPITLEHWGVYDSGVWAVINHNSDFSIVAPLFEPSTYVLLLVSAFGLHCIRRRKKQP